MFTRLPERMVGYTTYELAERLAALTAPQRDAIDRIVQHVYLDNGAWADLFRGEDRICSETSYYRRGKVDPETGEVSGRVGWGHNPQFQAALNEAVKLALAAKERERLGWLQRAKRRAEEKAEAAVDTWVDVMRPGNEGADRIKAAKEVIELAFKGAGDADDAGTKEAADWWAAAEDEHGSA